jgi:replicative DNA helicase
VGRLREYKALRDVIGTLEVAVAEAYEHKNLGATVSRIQDAARAGVQEMGSKVLSPRDMLRAVAAEMMLRRDPEMCTTGLPTMDAHMGGFQHEQVTIFGASTNWGKSSYAVLVSDLAFSDKKRIKRPLLVSFEDPETLYGRRLTARRAEVSPNLLRNNKYEPGMPEWRRVLGVAEHAEDNPFFINAIGKTVERAAMEIKCMCAAEQYDLVIIDYLQAIQSAKRHQDKRNEITYIARTLTDVIKTSKCAGLMFSQFRRPLKEGEKPTMHMLKESGDLENAAEVVMIGFLDKNGTRVIRTEKVKDGIKHKEYLVGWNDVTCGFTGEIDVVNDPEPLIESDYR